MALLDPVAINSKSYEQNRAEYERIIKVFAAHNIGYFFYNGGGDSHDTIHKISQISQDHGISTNLYWHTQKP